MAHKKSDHYASLRANCDDLPGSMDASQYKESRWGQRNGSSLAEETW